MKKRGLVTVEVPACITYPDFKKKSWRKNYVEWVSENIPHHEEPLVWRHSIPSEIHPSQTYDSLMVAILEPPRDSKLVSAINSVASRVSWWAWVLTINRLSLRGIRWVARIDVPNPRGSVTYVVYREGSNKGPSNFRLININTQTLQSCMAVEDVLIHIKIDTDPLVEAPLHISSTRAGIQRRVHSILGDSKP